ncbi:MAG: ribulose-phosphate 3-epimerase [Parcubacteria group bacterium Gr01-1014_33]|nr:MAG: ribulose-phosphate 3-epimerase [Parcubacteria group bacterium Gr01-1014_33]
MVDIIPSINVPTFEEVKERVAKVEPYVSWCHLDVTDGVFSTHPTWRNPADLPLLDTRLKVEVHLMVREPEKIMEKWLVAPVKRIIVHIEAAKDMHMILRKCREAGIQTGLSMNPETMWGEVEFWYEKVDIIQILGVRPGPSGQKIHEEIFEKIAHVRKFCNQCIIEVDGGVNGDTARRAVSSGADILVVGSYLFGAEDIASRLKEINGVSA